MLTSIHRLLLPLVFPQGLCPGEGKTGNFILIAKDGAGRPVLRGTALAGALRHAWSSLRPDECPEKWFGDTLDADKRERSSRLRIPDTVIELGQTSPDTITRTHNAINRHTGSVLEGSLFSLEALPPFARAKLCLWLFLTHSNERDCPTPEQAKGFLADIVAIFHDGLTLGGNVARGIGLAKLDGEPLYREFPCSDLEQHAAALDELRAWRAGNMPSSGELLPPSTITEECVLSVQLALGIPNAQDLLIADGQGLDFEMQPQRVRAADGSVRWRIPGASLRGVFRAWMTRLAAREGLPVADSAQRWRESQQLTGDDLAWGFASPEHREKTQDLLLDDPSALERVVPCPIMRLFGSCYAKSRIHVTDALSEPVSSSSGFLSHEQPRMHVAVDRITGGASEGFLFDNTVITSGPLFTCTVVIRHPREHEVRWLVSTLRALHLGVLRIGSSKAGGRLALACPPHAKGPFANLITSISLQEA